MDNLAVAQEAYDRRVAEAWERVQAAQARFDEDYYNTESKRTLFEEEDPNPDSAILIAE